MSLQLSKKIYTSLSFLSLLLLLLTTTGGCADDILHNPNEGPGDGTVSMTLSFEPMYASNLTTRTEGDAIKNITSLGIVFFATDGSLIKIVNQGDSEILDWNLDQNGNTFEDKTEAHTPKATFRLKDIPFGVYRAYAVANMGNITREMVVSDTDGITDEEKLKGTILRWETDDIPANNQMFGYFSTDDSRPGDFNAPDITIGQNTPKLYAWVRRAASKVTIAFNAADLKDNVWIYINKVTIHDIPRTCKLGETNTPNSVDELIAEGGSLYYGNSGVIPADRASDDYHQWLTLTNDDREPVGSDHSETAEALFFYENMQGDYKDDPDKDKYDKRQDKSPALGVLVDPGDPDYKDEVPYGTYIEVEAYYDSQNPDNITSGKIIYRFMLGKDVEYNYNAERNHHYKLTLVFNGWANQADWHIEYTQEDPSIQVPAQFYMPYLYNQQAMFPMTLNGNLQSLNVEIIENGWAPVTVDTHQVPSQAAFTWNEASYNLFGPVEYDYLGFLALAVPDDNRLPDKNILSDYNFTQGETAFEELQKLYEEEHTSADGYKWSQKKRSYNVTPGTYQREYNAYTVTKNIGESYSVQIPLWTRNKSMIENSGFTGNNPYEAYERKAVIRITAYFLVNGEPKKEEKEVPIYQVRRIVNPKGVWRSYSNNEQFFVHLMTLDSPDATSYTPLESQGTWKAQIESGDKSFCYITTDPNATTGRTEINGATGSEVKFYIKFRDNVSSGHSKGCVINIYYNGTSCTHKILVRQGYDEAIPIIGSTPLWSSFNLFQVNCADNLNNSSNYTLDAELACNPLAVGSLFRRRNYNNGILVSNNNTYGPLVPVGDGELEVAQKGTDGKWLKKKWSDIEPYHTENANTIYKWATFSAIPSGSTTAKTYRVPTYDEFKTLDNADYAVGIVYADGATSTQEECQKAYGFEDGNNTLKRSDMGVRGFIVYNATTGNQILFPIGKYGMARRTQFNVASSADYGYLRYGDVYDLLTQAANEFNKYRPIPYDLRMCPGAVYWINLPQPNGHPSGYCGGWDMNYFSLDFSSYTYNNRNDACPVKLVVN